MVLNKCDWQRQSVLPKMNEKGIKKEIKLQNLFIHLTSNICLMPLQYISITLCNLWQLYNLLSKPEISFIKFIFQNIYGVWRLLRKQPGSFQWKNRLAKRPELTKFSKLQGEKAGHGLNYLLVSSIAFSFLIFLMHKIYSQNILYQNKTIGQTIVFKFCIEVKISLV